MKDDEEAGGNNEQSDGEKHEAEAIEHASGEHPVMTHPRLGFQPFALLFLHLPQLSRVISYLFYLNIGGKGWKPLICR